MSQWNTTYAYNGQYQAGNAWNGDLNGQYVNQPYYPNRQDPSGQYVSFNDFLSQMQTNNTVPNNVQHFPNVPYENYAPAQYNYQNVPSTSQEPQRENYNYSTSSTTMPNSAESYHGQRQYNVNPTYSNDLILKSNLTPTATEFVPKSMLKTPSNSQKVCETPSSCNGVHETVNTPSTSSETNWRERPQSSHKNGDTNGKDASNRSHRNNRNYESSSRNRETNYSDNKNNELSHESYRHNESKSRKNDSSNRHDNPRNYEPSSHNQESNYQNTDNDRSYNSNRNDKRGQSKINNRSRVKDSDVRTFYNSSVPKDSQDVRNTRNEGSGRQKNWAGSQRLRGVDRSNPDDELYANSYLHQRDDKLDRVKSENASSPIRFRNKNSDQVVAQKEMTQRERLTEQLDKGTLECLVCCERVKQIDPVWSCGNCYHVLHLKCIRKWAQSSTVEGKWRCPACQNPNEDIPSDYRCMCGAMRSPEYQRGSTGAHTCGKACKRPRSCPHPCTLLCHPGPCPPCQATVNKQCGCGAETRSILCSSKLPQVCGRVCQRTLECNVHKCAKECHEGPCDTCDEMVTQVCYCPAARARTVACTAESSGRAAWSCGAECARVLACGAHVCRAPCHPPPCRPCALLPDSVLTCPCGKTKVEREKRKSCTDPIPLCGNICAKPLPCGPAGDKHFCKLNCHEGPCPVCPDKTLLQCRCGHSSREVPCAELPEMLNNVLCQKKCNKKLSCGRHKCRSVCCASSTHRCGVVCGRLLSCQLHRCEEFCHTGRCAPCPRLSFDELHCECGAEVLLPPVRCGARPPPCSAPCRRPRACEHPPHHSCHSGDCPPCVVLTTKRCHGNHEERKTIPCSQEEFSCGLPCGKPLPCGKHNCIKTCHKGLCDTGKCTQPCTEKRPGCGHPCAAPCHSGAAEGSTAAACPSAAPCRRPVRATCLCGRRSAERACCDNARDYDRMVSALAATKMQDGGSVDLADVQRPTNVLKTLECEEECRAEARARRLALALQLRNPDVSSKLAPRYSEHVRATAQREPAFALHVHDKLTELVQLAKKSKQKTRSHSFPSMNWQKRQFIHEMCEHFGCESVAYDAEPNRNVVATADREKSWLPAMSVLEVLAREAGKRRVPPPVLRAPAPPPAPAAGPAHSAANKSSSGSGWATLTSTNAWAARSQPKPQPQPTSDAKIDYFDNPPDN
ncbi:protein shuttle craft isoform X2 [Manduca sexta]|uniref:protein shuttle craft isoform X2 n=1 Tax=Manduca sexta TaxID=7130 RepID=UPI00188F1150|nr:protein shuttle craft isoform X2 [Manduca sexta]